MVPANQSIRDCTPNKLDNIYQFALTEAPLKDQALYGMSTGRKFTKRFEFNPGYKSYLQLDPLRQAVEYDRDRNIQPGKGQLIYTGIEINMGCYLHLQKVCHKGTYAVLG